MHLERKRRQNNLSRIARDNKKDGRIIYEK